MKCKMRVFHTAGLGSAIVPASGNVFPKTKKAAIRHSIEKYKWLLQWATDNQGGITPFCGIVSCALCKLYYDGGFCMRCPVYKKTGRPDCRNTPWDELARAANAAPVTPDTLKVIQAEIEFLESLL